MLISNLLYYYYKNCSLDLTIILNWRFFLFCLNNASSNAVKTNYCFAVSQEVHPSHISNINNWSHISAFFKTYLNSQWLCNDHLTSRTIQQSHISQPKIHKSQISVPQILQYHILQMVYTPLCVLFQYFKISSFTVQLSKV